MPEYSRILIEQYCMDHSKNEKGKIFMGDGTDVL